MWRPQHGHDGTTVNQPSRTGRPPPTGQRSRSARARSVRAPGNGGGAANSAGSAPGAVGLDGSLDIEEIVRPLPVLLRGVEPVQVRYRHRRNDDQPGASRAPPRPLGGSLPVIGVKRSIVVDDEPPRPPHPRRRLPHRLVPEALGLVHPDEAGAPARGVGGGGGAGRPLAPLPPAPRAKTPPPAGKRPGGGGAPR